MRAEELGASRRGEGVASALEGLERGLGRGPERGPQQGIELGHFGLFATGLLSVSMGLAGFCGSCFLAILGLLVYSRTGGHAVDFANTYKYVGLPVGIAFTVVSAAVLLVFRLRRHLRESQGQVGSRTN